MRPSFVANSSRKGVLVSVLPLYPMSLKPLCGERVGLAREEGGCGWVCVVTPIICENEYYVGFCVGGVDGIEGGKEEEGCGY